MTSEKNMQDVNHNHLVINNQPEEIVVANPHYEEPKAAPAHKVEEIPAKISTSSNNSPSWPTFGMIEPGIPTNDESRVIDPKIIPTSTGG